MISMSIRHLLFAALWAAFFLPLMARAEVYRAEGVASLELGPVAARQQAIEDAVRQMAMTHAGTVQAWSGVESGVLSEAMITGPRTLPGVPKVVSESRRDGLLFLMVELDTAAPSAGAGPVATAGNVVSAQACARPFAPPGRLLGRRMVATYFEVGKPQDASDLGNLATWLPSALVQRLNRQRDVRALDAGAVSLFPGGRVQEPWQAGDAVRDIGRREDVQFVLAGRVVDTSVTRKEPRASAFGVGTPGAQGLYYTGPFAGFLGGAVRVVPVARQFEMEYWLYDALSGSVLLNDRVKREARGDVHAESLRTFEAEVFERTDYGREVMGALDGVTVKLAATMHCLPFVARVVRVDGQRIYLSAGVQDGLASDDRLLLYKQQPKTEIRRPDGTVLGMPEQMIGDVTLVQVQPRFSIAEVRNARGKVDVGDWVRFPAWR